MKQYRAIILDDDSITIVLLKKIIKEYCPLINLVGEALSTEAAISQIQDLEPDIIFLDIVIKNSLVFEMIDRLDHPSAQIIFITSESQFALKAFRYNAIDYLLKPLQATEVVKAVNKAISSINMQHYTRKEEPDKKEHKNLMAISSMDKIELVKINEVMLLSSEGKYTSIYLEDGKKIVSTKNLGFYEGLLDKSIFFRTHHSHIINIHFVSEIVRKDGFYCEMVNKLVIPISKRKQDDFNRFIGLKE